MKQPCDSYSNPLILSKKFVIISTFLSFFFKVVIVEVKSFRLILGISFLSKPETSLNRKTDKRTEKGFGETKERE